MAVYTKLSRKDAEWIAKRWRLGAPKRLDGIAKGSVNTNHRLVTASGAYFVRLEESREREEVEAEARLLAHLAARGLPTPEPLPDAKGRAVAELKDKPLVVFPWMPGEDRAAEDYSLRDLAAAGAMLARLHHAAKGWTEPLRNRFSRAAIAARWWRIRKKARIPAAHRDEIDAALVRREPPPAGPGGVVHGDWFADNLLFDEKNVIVAVLDFGAAAVEDLTCDVATAVNALCWKKSDPDRFDRRRVAALLDGYGDARGPASLEDAALDFWLRASALRFTVTRVQDFRMKKSSLRVEKDYRDFLRRLRFWSKKPFRRP